MQAQILYGRLLLALAGGLFCAALTYFNWIAPLDRIVYDLYNEASYLPEADDIVIVAIDERSLLELGRWPWPRERHIELLRQLKIAETQSVAMDILFTEPTPGYPQVDELLAEAIAAHGSVVLPVFITDINRGGLQEVHPVPKIAAAAAALGHVHIEIDSDGVARRVFLKQGLGETRWFHFAAALARVSHLSPDALPGIVDAKVLEQPNPRAIIRSHENLIPFTGPAGTLKQIPYVDVMKGRVPRENLQGKIVFVGATAAGQADNITTSLGQISGVEVNANIFHALRTQALSKAISPGVAAGLAFLLAAITILVFTKMNPRQLLLSILVSAALLLLVTYSILQFWRLWISPASMILTLFIVYPLWNWIRLDTALGFIRDQLEKLESENQNLYTTFTMGDGPPAPELISDFLNIHMHRLDNAYREALQNRDLIKGTLAQLGSGVILADPSGEILLINEQAKEILNISGDSNVLQLALAGVELTQEESMVELVDRLLFHRKPFSCEGRSRECGRDLFFQGGVIGGDNPLRLLVLTDVSELKHSERRRVEALNFLSHDLRAPLTSVLALIEDTKAGQANKINADLLAQIEDYIRKNLSYAENFLQLAKIEHGGPLQRVEFDARSLMDNAVSQLFHAAQKIGTELKLFYPDDDIWVQCDSALIERSLINLIDNALKHSSPGDTISITLSANDDYVIFEISDQGEGISTGDMNRIFSNFEQGQAAKTGVGLGLRFVKVVAENHGGNVTVENNTTAGATFKFKIARELQLPE